jgi:HEAT repeat protein
VIRGAGSHPSAAVNGELVRLLATPDVEAAAAAAIALGTPGNAVAVGPLSEALNSKEKRIAMAAIRGLGAIGNAEARVALASAAESHDDSSIRRRAAAELRILDAHRR